MSSGMERKRHQRNLADRSNEPGESVNLSGKVALVTGASRGIGRGIAEAFGAAGASVAVNYRTGARAAEQVATSIRLSGHDAIAIQADVAEEEDVDHMVTTVLDQFGR